MTATTLATPMKLNPELAAIWDRLPLLSTDEVVEKLEDMLEFEEENPMVEAALQWQKDGHELTLDSLKRDFETTSDAAERSKIITVFIGVVALRVRHVIAEEIITFSEGLQFTLGLGTSMFRAVGIAGNIQFKGPDGKMRDAEPFMEPVRQ